jgi:hypothetical protein
MPTVNCLDPNYINPLSLYISSMSLCLFKLSVPESSHLQLKYMTMSFLLLSTLAFHTSSNKGVQPLKASKAAEAEEAKFIRLGTPRCKGKTRVRQSFLRNNRGVDHDEECRFISRVISPVERWVVVKTLNLKARGSEIPNRTANWHLRKYLHPCVK